MLKTTFFALFVILSFSVFAQAQYEPFKQDKELQAAFINKDLTPFISEPVLFICDTVESQANASQLADLMKKYIPKVKNAVIQKASETSNGYVQTYGMYKDDEALYYIRFTLNQLSGKLEEVEVTKN
jgi:hypothetical protein